MSLSGVLFLAAATQRSKAYAQALVREALIPETVILFGGEPKNPLVSDKAPETLNGLKLHDPALPLIDSCRALNPTPVQMSTKDVNDPALAEEVARHHPRLIVYSGFGGQIVRENLFALGVPILHVHSGWLPDYRGSTTLYYSILEEGDCAASALLIEPTIDTGPVLLRTRYPSPPAGCDIDHLYDGAIRADVLVQVMEHYKDQGSLPEPIDQEEEGRTFFVIHPVLKHLALLSLKQEDD